jgi:hypothetical protein
MKKGRIDFGPWFIMVAVLLLLALLGLALFRGITVQKENIQGNELTIFEVYEESKQIEYYARQAGIMSAQRSLQTLYTNGGLYDTDDCGTIGDYIKWNEPNKTCTINPYSTYATYLSIDMSARMDAYAARTRNENIKKDYEFYVDKSTIAGIALEPVEIPFLKQGEVVDTELLYITVDTHIGPRARMGTVYVNPSFSFPYASNIDEFLKLQELTRFIDDICARRQNQTACVQRQVNFTRSQGLNVTVEPWTDNYYLLTTSMHPPPTPHFEYPPVRIAWHVPPPLTAPQNSAVQNVTIPAA